MSSQEETFVFYLLIVFTSIFGLIILNGNLLLYTYDSMQEIKDAVLNKCKILVKYVIDIFLYYMFYIGLIYGTLYTDYWLFQYCLSIAILRSALDEITFNLDAPAVIYIYGTLLLLHSLYKAQNQNILMYINQN
jgi:hypothetical protein